MSNILYITSYFLPKASANGICIYNIAKQHIERGDSVFCICQKGDEKKNFEIIDGINVYRVEDSWFAHFYKRNANKRGFSRLVYKLVHSLRNVCLIPFYPNVSPKRSKKVFKLADKLIRENDIDTVIGAFRPYEAIYTVHKLKKKYNEKLKCVSYYLDPLWQKKNVKLGKNFYDKRSQSAQRKDLTLLDAVILPIKCKDDFEGTYGIHNNVGYVDFPLYVKENVEECEFEFDKSEISLAYVGSLDKSNRNPEALLRALREIKKEGINIKLHIWGTVSDAKEIISSYSDVAQYNGYIDYGYVKSLLCKADCLVSVSNKVVYDMVPSKIFQLFSTEKPIINLLSNEKDVSTEYFERYGDVCTLKAYGDTDSFAEQIKEFLNRQNCERTNVDTLFAENTPAFVIDKITEVLSK